MLPTLISDHRSGVRSHSRREITSNSPSFTRATYRAYLLRNISDCEDCLYRPQSNYEYSKNQPHSLRRPLVRVYHASASASNQFPYYDQQSPSDLIIDLLPTSSPTYLRPLHLPTFDLFTYLPSTSLPTYLQPPHLPTSDLSNYLLPIFSPLNTTQ